MKDKQKSRSFSPGEIEMDPENGKKSLLLRGFVHFLLGCGIFGLLGAGAAALLLCTKLENLKFAVPVCLGLPVPLFLLLLLAEKRLGRGKPGVFREILPSCGGPLLLYGILCAVGFRILPAGLFSLLLTVGTGAAAYLAGSLLLLRLFFAVIFRLLTPGQREKSPPDGEKKPDEKG